MKIAVIGGTGPQGRGLASRLALAGHQVRIGSRDAARAQEKAAEIRAKAGDVDIAGDENLAAADSAEAVLLAVSYAGHSELISSLAPALTGKVVISCVNPLGFDKQGPYALNVPGGSAAEEAQKLAPDAQVVGAFHHVSAVSKLRQPTRWQNSRQQSPGTAGCRRESCGLPVSLSR